MIHAGDATQKGKKQLIGLLRENNTLPWALIVLTLSFIIHYSNYKAAFMSYGSMLTTGARHLSRAPKQLWPGHTEWSNLCLIKLLIKLSHAKTVKGVNQQCLCSTQSAFLECPCANETEGKCFEFGSSRLRNNYRIYRRNRSRADRGWSCTRLCWSHSGPPWNPGDIGTGSPEGRGRDQPPPRTLPRYHTD